MPIYIKNLKDLEGMLKNKISNGLYFSSNLQDVMAENMQDIIVDNVYDAYKPDDPESRRGNEGGFSDTNNMVFTDVDTSGNGVKFTFENITEGADSMRGEELADLFETGNGVWDNPEAYDEYGRKNSDKRPFMQDSIDQMNINKAELVNALKKDLKNLGFKVK